MSSSFSSWPNWLLLLVVLTAGCSGSFEEWPRSEAVDDGGFTVRMPQASGAQLGELVLGRDTLVSHINILADSGITYASAWFDVPLRWRPLPKAQVLDSIWPLAVQRVSGTLVDDIGPLQSEGPGERGAWFVNSDDIRLGVVVRVMGDRAMLMNAATPARYFRAREQRNMLRFLNSFEATTGR